MNYYKNNIKHVKGDTYSSALIVEGLGQALDSVYFTCRDSLKNDSTILFEKSLADGGITQVEYDEENDIRKYAVRIDPYDTRNLQAGTYFYDLQITVNTDVFTIMKGDFILEQDASRKGEPTEPEIIIQIKAQLDEINGELVSVNVLDKLDYLSNTKELIKDSLNNLGSEITDDNTFRNYASKIDDLYNEWPKVTGEASEFTLVNTKKGKMQLDIKGNTEQTTYTGKNLLNNTATSQTINGITFTINEDNSVLVNGTSTALITFNLIGSNTFTLPAGTYVLSGCPTGGSDNSYRIDINNGAEFSQRDYGSGNTFTLSSDLTVNNVRIRIASGTTINNLVFKPMIRLSSITNDTYEPYVGGTASPNPNYPQDIRVVKDDNTINIIGKNLFDKNNVNVLNGYITSTKISGSSETRTIYIPCMSNTNYTISRIQGARFRVATTTDTPTINANVSDYIGNDTATSITVTTGSSANYLCVFFYHSNYDTLTEQEILNTIQIEENNQATSYEPFKNNTYNIDLGDIELCKIGNYKDYIYKENNKWYIYKEIEKVVLDGSENWSYSSGSTQPFRLVIDNIESITQSDTPLVLTNYFTPFEWTGSTKPDYGITHNVKTIAIRNKDNLTDLANFKTWLSNNNTILYYVLDTPTNTEITDLEIIEQLNFLESSISYNNTTNIIAEYEEGNAPFIISASALMKGSE